MIEQHKQCSMIECAGAYTLRINLIGNIIGCSTKMAVLLGLEEATLLGQSINTLLEEPIEEKTIRAMKEILGVKGVLVKQCTIRNQANKQHTFKARYMMQSANEVMISFEQQGRVVHTGIHSEREDMVVEALQLKVCLLDEEGHIISVSQELARDMEERGIYLVKYRDITLFGTTIAAKFKAMIEEGLQGITFDYYIEAGRWIRVLFRLIADDTIVMQLKDVQWEKVSKYLLEKSNQGILLEDEEGICYTNQKTRELLGIIEPDTKQMRLLNFIHFDYKMTFLEVFKSNVERKRMDRRCYLKTIEGKEIEIEYKAEHIGTGEKTLDHYYINEILPHTSMEKQRQKYQEAIDTVDEMNVYDSIKTKVLTNISHEFRTPINIIRSALQLIKWDNNIDNTLIKQLDKIEKNTHRLTRLVDNLLAMGQVDVGSIDMHLKDYDIVSLLGILVDCTRDYIVKRGLTISFVSNRDELMMGCDKEMIQHIVLNLLSNAIKVTEPGGIIGVRLRHMETVCIIEISDTGYGIPVEKKEEIYKRFGQTDELWNRKYEGSGTGIPLAKALVELHGGEIAFESEVDKGTIVTITLPIHCVGEAPCSRSVEEKQDTMNKVTIAFSDIY